MKHILLITLLSLTSLFWRGNEAFAQNLVPNPSFEVYDTCPNYVNQVRYAVPWTNPIHNGTTSDYFNACDTTSGLNSFNVPYNYLGFQYARTGVAYTLVVTAWFPGNLAAWNLREYIQVELTSPLIAGVDYFVRWYVSACDSCHYISNNIGMYFSPVEISETCPACPMPLPFIPQIENPINNNLNDRTGWTEISGSYTASGGEKYIIIGNFRDTSLTVATYTGWSNPISNYYDIAAYYIDDVCVSTDSAYCNTWTGNEYLYDSNISIIPNPANTFFQINGMRRELEIKIYDIVGKLILDTKTNNNRLNIESIPNGIYLIKINLKNKSIIQKIIIQH